MSADITCLRKLCLNLMEEARQNKETITTLISESRKTKKVSQLEEKIEMKKAILCKAVTRLDKIKELK